MDKEDQEFSTELDDAIYCTKKIIREREEEFDKSMAMMRKYLESLYEEKAKMLRLSATPQVRRIVRGPEK